MGDCAPIEQNIPLPYGSREKGETPEQGQKRKYPEVDLKNGDTIRAGETVLSVKIECNKAVGPVLCAQCGKDVTGEIGGRREGSYICQACRQSMEMDPAQILRDMLAKKAGKPTTAKPMAPTRP